MWFFTFTLACTCWGTRSWPLTWLRRSLGGCVPRPSRSTIGSLPSTRIRRRLTTLLRPTRRSWRRGAPAWAGGVAASDVVFAGESAGGGLVVATLANARDRGLPLPAASLVMSPYVDLTLAGASMDSKREVDPLLSREALQARVGDYTARQDPALGLISPVFADLSGLPPLIIQAGSHEVLLDDAVRLARQAATADVEVTLDLTPKVPHVFQNFYPILDEAADALDRG